ncbi:unnamed protein product [Camellia sinensis]
MTASWTSFKFLFLLKYYCFEISVSVAHNVTCLSVFFFGIKDHDPDYMEPNRLRPRLDCSDPAAHAHRYQDSFGAGNNLHSHDYYGSDYGEESYSSFYGNDHPYGGGYYY